VYRWFRLDASAATMPRLVRFLLAVEGTFTICSFWLVSALSETGKHQRARDLCERLLSYASPATDDRTGTHARPACPKG
jgi:hypothetical protein